MRTPKSGRGSQRGALACALPSVVFNCTVVVCVWCMCQRSEDNSGSESVLSYLEFWGQHTSHPAFIESTFPCWATSQALSGGLYVSWRNSIETEEAFIGIGQFWTSGEFTYPIQVLSQRNSHGLLIESIHVLQDMEEWLTHNFLQATFLQISPVPCLEIRCLFWTVFFNVIFYNWVWWWESIILVTWEDDPGRSQILGLPKLWGEFWTSLANLARYCLRIKKMGLQAGGSQIWWH